MIFGCHRSFSGSLNVIVLRGLLEQSGNPARRNSPGVHQIK
ncbi:hypothetical protein D3OALGA1CA_2997 [Olavius algarvensis associated proteobacterium Delta 3]|nr:hypothetical protein D3OALGA1CA_2997 [Olavius algarvensis associated proteobacterium Delta 3]CAB5157124.1 hypothetical protein D3OALGB2SA_5178 [Olavius algarvensis associated proteobacterium Delta 3]